MLGPILVSLHNLRHFQRLMLDIRRAIREDAWSDLERRWPVILTGPALSSEVGAGNESPAEADRVAPGARRPDHGKADQP